MPQPPVLIIGNEPDQGVIKKSHAGIVFLHGSKLLIHWRTMSILYQRGQLLYEMGISATNPFFYACQVMKPANSSLSIKPNLVCIIHPNQQIWVDSFVL